MNPCIIDASAVLADRGQPEPLIKSSTMPHAPGTLQPVQSNHANINSILEPIPSTPANSLVQSNISLLSGIEQSVQVMKF